MEVEDEDEDEGGRYNRRRNSVTFVKTTSRVTCVFSIIEAQ
jgi:hypothetical protein